MGPGSLSLWCGKIIKSTAVCLITLTKGFKREKNGDGLKEFGFWGVF